MSARPARNFSPPNPGTMERQARPPKNIRELSRELSITEFLIAKYVHEAMSNLQIAFEISSSEQTVKNHLRHIFDKTGMGNRLELALWFEVHHCDGKCLQDLNL